MSFRDRSLRSLDRGKTFRRRTLRSTDVGKTFQRRMPASFERGKPSGSRSLRSFGSGKCFRDRSLRSLDFGKTFQCRTLGSLGNGKTFPSRCTRSFAIGKRGNRTNAKAPALRFVSKRLRPRAPREQAARGHRYSASIRASDPGAKIPTDRRSPSRQSLPLCNRHFDAFTSMMSCGELSRWPALVTRM